MRVPLQTEEMVVDAKMVLAVTLQTQIRDPAG